MFCFLLIVRVLNLQSSPGFKTTGWLQGRLSLLISFWGQSNKLQEFLETQWLKVNCLLTVLLLNTANRMKPVFIYFQGIMQKKYGASVLGKAENDWSWGLGGFKSPRGSRAMPWKMHECKCLNNFVFFFLKNTLKLWSIGWMWGKTFCQSFCCNPK